MCRSHCGRRNMAGFDFFFPPTCAAAYCTLFCHSSYGSSARVANSKVALIPQIRRVLPFKTHSSPPAPPISCNFICKIPIRHRRRCYAQLCPSSHTATTTTTTWRIIPLLASARVAMLKLIWKTNFHYDGWRHLQHQQQRHAHIENGCYCMDYTRNGYNKSHLIITLSGPHRFLHTYLHMHINELFSTILRKRKRHRSSSVAATTNFIVKMWVGWALPKLTCARIIPQQRTIKYNFLFLNIAPKIHLLLHARLRQCIPYTLLIIIIYN